MDLEKKSNNNWAMYAGPLVAAVMWLSLSRTGLNSSACWVAAITTWCGVWWIFEPVSIPATSIVPFALFPLVGVLNHKQVAAGYGHSMVLLFAGGFMIAQGLEKSGAHRRLAIGMVRAVGGKGGRRLVLGFMLAAATLSMWITNTATTMMLLPVAMAVLEQLEEKDRQTLAVPLMLGLAYAASIGGMGTPIGTPPNVIFMGFYNEFTGKDISFLGWMKIALPVVVIMFPVIWLWLCRKLGKAKTVELPVLGPWRTEERRVLIVFLLTALAWILRKEPLGGWSGLLGAKGAGDSTVALAAVMVLFICPNGHGGRLLNWQAASKIPWGLLLMVGAGMTLAKAFATSGLSEAIGNSVVYLKTWPVLVMTAVLSISVGFLTNVTSNTAMAALLMPLLAAASAAAGINPTVLMIPAVLSVSFAFMLPIGTPPNAIVYGSGYISVRTMVREGFIITLLGTWAVTIVCYLLLPILINN